MDETDYGTFERAFVRVSGAFRLKLKPVEITDLARTYFRVLQEHRLDLVLAAGKLCIARGKVFPKVADWIANLSPANGGTASCPPDRRQMGVTEMEDHARAAAKHYVDDPCACLLCQEAGVSDRPLRFVPEADEHAFNPRRGVVEPVGHWAHGEELRRWYLAREGFMRCAPAQVRRALQLVGEREPGQEG